MSAFSKIDYGRKGSAHDQGNDEDNLPGDWVQRGVTRWGKESISFHDNQPGDKPQLMGKQGEGDRDGDGDEGREGR